MFLAHPMNFFVAALKSYRDFFLPDETSIYSFGSNTPWSFIALVLWAGVTVLLIWGVVRLLRNIRFNEPSLLLAGFIGIVLSIPFLPPIDGGPRFYASSMPFFFALPAVALSQFPHNSSQTPGLDKPPRNELLLCSLTAVMLLGLTVIMPVVTYYLSSPPTLGKVACPVGQAAFAIKPTPDSYIDLKPDGTTQCGFAPAVCLSDFNQNGSQKSIDDFYQVLFSLAQSGSSGIRIIPSINLLDAKFHYFVNDPTHNLLLPAKQVLSGCATEIRTNNQSIYQIESLVSP